MPESILDTDNAVLTFKERQWRVQREAPFEWAIASPHGDPVGILRCVDAVGAEGDPIFALALPGVEENPPTTGSDWLSIIEYAINEYLAAEPTSSDSDVE